LSSGLVYGPPSLTNFQAFVQNVVGISAAYLPLSSPQYQHAFDQAMNIVNADIGSVLSVSTSFSVIELATYNLGAHLLIEFAQDVSWSIFAASWSVGLATITTSVANTVQVGDMIGISGVSPYAYDNAPGEPPAFVVNSVIDSQNFNYPLSPNPGAAIIAANALVSEMYFVNARWRLQMAAFSPGVVTSAGDLSTSAGLLNPEFMSGLTLEDLNLLKTSYGRAYLSIAQKYGPTIWGLS